MPNLNTDFDLLDEIMEVEGYLGQGEMYFSESAGQLLRIEEMIPKYALNCFNKLSRQFGTEFLGSALAEALIAHVSQYAGELSHVLTRHGTATVYVGEGGPSVNAARKRLRRAGADRTHKKDEAWVEGIVTVPVVTVKRRKERAHA